MARKSLNSNRSSPFANRKAKSASGGGVWFAEMRDWCRGKWWFPRLMFMVWFAYLWVRLIQNPDYPVIFGAINLGIHEIGHILWSPLGEFMMFLGGSLTQCLAPVVAMIVFYRQSDYFGISFSFGWLSTCLYNVSVYMADARTRALTLVSPFGSDPMHDWNYLLGRMGMLEADRFLGGIVNGLAFASMLTFMALGGYQIWLMITLPPDRGHIRIPGLDKDIDEDVD